MQKNQRIQAFVRLRPLNQQEKSKCPVQVVDCPGSREVVVRDRGANNLTKTFSFDRVFGIHSKQIDVYKTVLSPLVEEVLCGYNCCVFAYGQTGTGKTFTMEGERSSFETSWEKDPLAGIVPRALSQLYDELRLQNAEFSVRVSFVELYNEELYDLLSPSEDSKLKTLRLYEDPAKKGSVIMQGVEEVTVHNKNEVYAILERGSEKRKTAATLMNANSSRSHTVFTVTVHIKEQCLEGEDLLKTGKLHLVDLAGSENISRSGAVDKRAREAGSINQSLLTLGRVITCLVDKSPHIPYRESKLTRLLQDSLGGRTKTAIIATISPSLLSLEETLSTLEYAHRAKNIQNKPEINQKLTKKTILSHYTEEIARLRKDLVAAHEKNGFFVDKGNYDDMLQQLESQRQELSNNITYHRNLEDQLAVKTQELEDQLSVNSELNEELELIRSCLRSQQTQNKVLTEENNRLQSQNNQAICLVKAHANTEEKLSNQATQLLYTANEATYDLSKLYTKLDNQRELQRSNFESGLRMENSVKEQIKEIFQLTEAYRKSHAEYCGSERLKSQEWMVEFTEKLKETKKSFSIAMGDILRNCLDNILESKEKVAKISDEGSNISKELTQVEKEILNHINGSLQLHDSVLLRTEQAFSEFMGSLTQLSEKTTDRVNEFYETTESQIDQYKLDMKAISMSFNQFCHLLDTLISKCVANYKDQSENVESVIRSSCRKAQDARNKLDEVMQELNGLADQNEVFSTEYTHFHGKQVKEMNEERKAIMTGFRKLESKVSDGSVSNNSLAQNILESLSNDVSSAKKIGEENWAKIIELDLAKKTSSSEYKKSMEQNFMKLSESSTLCKSMNQELISFLENQVEPMDKIKEGGKEILNDGFVKLQQAVSKSSNMLSDALEDHCILTEKNMLEVNEDLSNIQGQMSEFWEKTYQCELHTAQTPQRKEFDYPQNFSKTSPYMNILQRYRRERRHSSMTSADSSFLARLLQSDGEEGLSNHETSQSRRSLSQNLSIENSGIHILNNHESDANDKSEVVVCDAKGLDSGEKENIPQTVKPEVKIAGIKQNNEKPRDKSHKRK